MKTPNSLFPENEKKFRLRVPLPRTLRGRRRLIVGSVVLAMALSGYIVSWLAYPRPLIGRERTISSVIGKTVDAATRELTALGFKVKVAGDEPDPELPAGTVTWQDPPADLAAPSGTTVTLTRSTGPSSIPVP